MKLSGIAVFAAFAVFSAASAPAYMTFTWNSSGTGDFNDPSKWGPGYVPSDPPPEGQEPHYVYFRPNGDLTVNFPVDASSARMYVRDSRNVTFQLQGNTYTTGLVASHTNAPGSLTILDGTLLNTGGSNIAGATVTFIFQIGAGGIYSLGAGSANLNLGHGEGGDGTIRIADGGLLSGPQSTGAILLGTHADATGLLLVEGRATGGGAASRLSFAGDMALGGTTSTNQGSGSLNLRGGGIAEIGGVVRTWDNGTIDVGAGSAMAAGSLTMESGSTLKFELHHDQAGPLLALSGNAALNTGSALAISLAESFIFTQDSAFELVRYGGSLGGTAGAFTGWTEGGVYTIGGHDFLLSYGSGSDDAIMLTAIPEPASIAVFLVGAGILALRRRANRRRA